MQRHVAVLSRCARGARSYSSRSRAHRLWASEDFAHRTASLERYYRGPGDKGNARYPRIGSEAIDARQYLDAAEAGIATPDETFQVVGRVASVRVLGSKLVFADLEAAGKQIQVEASFNGTAGGDELQRGAWDLFRKTVSVGDHWSFFGRPKPIEGNRVEKPTLRADQIPTLLAPRLQSVPAQVTDPNTLTSFPQLSLMMNNRKRKLLQFRHILEQSFRTQLEAIGFISASTPILAGTTGGATATPFVTSTKFLSESQLKLRIATELDLKMLVTAGIPRVYELGRVFRNEGIDAHHNPEFTTCELYMAYANLDTLVSITENLMMTLRDAAETFFTTVPYLGEWTTPFPVINFVPALEAEIRRTVPNFVLPRTLLPTPSAELLHVCKQCGIPVDDDTPSTAHVLDLLASKFLEPLTRAAPTFIAYHPSITAPLAKSFIDPHTGHEVAARMELFVGGTEYANFYEEENDPLAQMKKFIRQGGHIGVDDQDLELQSYATLFKRLSPAQQYYVRVMEMGMPPTAGWGAGIDRLAMLFGGAERISDVLPFGNLRHVLAMGD